MARKFLYVIATIIVLFLAAMFALRFWSEDLTEWAFVPDTPFKAQARSDSQAWDSPAMWIARPGLKDDPSRWLPAGVQAPVGELPVSVFFVHPTSYVEKGTWNGDPADPETRALASLFVQGMASPFNAAAQLWAPRYRQAAVGAFLTDRPEAEQALDLAYADVLAAFDHFVGEAPADRPIVLAGHSQGAFLLRRLMQDRVAGTPLAPRIAAAYLIGWPVSLTHDLPRMGVPACAGPNEAGCVVSWLTVADPADTTMLKRAYGRRKGLDGQPVGGSPFVCTNPLTGSANNAPVDSGSNLGTLVAKLADQTGAGGVRPTFDLATGELVPATVPAVCDADHFLHIGAPPKLDLGPYVLPGNNYHLYDMTLFWANLRSDFERRVGAWQKAR